MLVTFVQRTSVQIFLKIICTLPCWLLSSKEQVCKYFWKSSVPCHVGYFRPKNKCANIFENHLYPAMLVTFVQRTSVQIFFENHLYPAMLVTFVQRTSVQIILKIICTLPCWLLSSKEQVCKYFWKSSVPCHVGYSRPKNKCANIFENHLYPAMLVTFVQRTSVQIFLKIICTLPCWLLSSKEQGPRYFWKPSKPCCVGINWIGTLRWIPMCQGFRYFSFFLHHFVLGQISHQQLLWIMQKFTKYV